MELENCRSFTEQMEHRCLSPYAALSDQSRGRSRPEEKCQIRTDFARDRDRIIHCNAFRRLKQKTQVFLSPQGDHYRTRLTHTLEVSQIARTIARALRLNEDLTEAISLGHDLGHTPFGHIGERALNEIAPFSFAHPAQSIRVAEKLERDGKGLNLTYEVKNGIAAHSTGKPDADTLEGKVVELSDKIAYVNHDIEDAIRAGILREEELPYDSTYVLGRTKSERITTIISSIITQSFEQPEIKMEEEVWKAHMHLRQFMFDYVYLTSPVNAEEQKAKHIVQCLYRHFLEHQKQLPKLYQKVAQEEGSDRAVCDYVASMTDGYAANLYKELYLPKFFV